MKVIRSVKEMQNTMLEQKRSGKSIGFVPTMGYLHDGHLTLIKQARRENDIVAVSIFVNPLQFGANEDLSTYPRDFERDSQLAEESGADYLFYPDASEMYPRPLAVKVTVGDRTDVLCGRSRPGHFDGVAAVLLKLFNIVIPDFAYFGMKDAQQVAVIDMLITDYNIPVTLKTVETVRETDGLAKSSRNVYLQPNEREEAVILNKSLNEAREGIINGERDPEKVLSFMKERIEQNSSGTIDYIELYSYPELKPVKEIKGTIIIALAVKFTKARLIDNTIISI
ncbi:pantoate--beta-alanine ligase [Cytobacillus gottheilii]|uniref:Pantothenate synthetase n=1 Tax=Cytobacillus gottheilii TaxID=859144 RepID=A0ABX8F841_9BACI|nr:pantoate--beta-alanine ligase [Cytobacillus gottheilii]QVY60144.1 pantoate--beta-alanine ligase [Cytobacillus gottheilii]